MSPVRRRLRRPYARRGAGTTEVVRESCPRRPSGSSADPLRHPLKAPAGKWHRLVTTRLHRETMRYDPSLAPYLA